MPYSKKIMLLVLLMVVATQILFSLHLFDVVHLPTGFLRSNSTTKNQTLTSLASHLLDKQKSCYRYFETYLHKKKLLPVDRPPLYQPPCPLSSVLSDFHYLINEDICSKPNPDQGDPEIYMLVLVGSHPTNRAQRDVIRQTWGNPNITGFPFRLAFLFGNMTSPEMQEAIEEESQTHHDVIQGSFNDSYHNVTLRDLMGLRWAWQYCGEARFVMHADDDITIDVYRVIEELQERFPVGIVNRQQATDFVGCFEIYAGTHVLRSGRYNVTKDDHPSDVYAPYCQGWMYLTTPATAFQLDVASFRMRPYWMNDAYITGTLVEALGIDLTRLRLNYTMDPKPLKQEGYGIGIPMFAVGYTGIEPNLTKVLHLKYQRFAHANNLPKSRWIRNARSWIW